MQSDINAVATTLFSKLRFFFRGSILRAADANHATAECVTNNNLCTILGKQAQGEAQKPEGLTTQQTQPNRQRGGREVVK